MCAVENSHLAEKVRRHVLRARNGRMLDEWARPRFVFQSPECEWLGHDQQRILPVQRMILWWTDDDAVDKRVQPDAFGFDPAQKIARPSPGLRQVAQDAAQQVSLALAQFARNQRDSRPSALEASPQGREQFRRERTWRPKVG